MPRIIELKQGDLTLKEKNIKGFLERVVNSIEIGRASCRERV